MTTLRIGTRASTLALAQAQLFARSVVTADPSITCRLVPITTTGDRILDRPLTEVGGKGLFVRELDRALAAGEVDVTVHSCKDLPMDTPAELPLVAFSAREDPRDAVVLPAGVDATAPGFDLEAYLRESEAPVGCSSQRRQVQLAGVFGGVRVESVRGNVNTRLAKLDAGEYSALLLAAAGLERLGLAERIARCLSVSEMLPAAGQGIIVAQARACSDVSWAQPFDCLSSRACALAERAFVRALDGGCTKPCAAYATFDASTGGVALTGMYASDDATSVAYGARELGADDIESAAAALAVEVRSDANRG